MAGFLLNALRKKRINEEYCLIWLFFLIATDILVLNQKLLFFITHLVGALVPVSTLTMLSLILIIGMLIYFSMKVSVLSNKVQDIVQAMALQKRDFEEQLSRLKQPSEDLTQKSPSGASGVGPT